MSAKIKGHLSQASRSIHTFAARSVCPERRCRAHVSCDELRPHEKMSNMSNEETFKFLELYQSENCLWNPRNKHHKNKNIINDSWKRIADTMGIPLHEIKKKKESFMATFRINLKKKLDSLKSGAGEEDAFKPIWQFYDAMEVFLRDVYECKSICNSEEHTQGGEESLRTDELEVGGSSSTTEMYNSDAGNSAFQSPLQNRNPATASKAQKRRAQNPIELQEASKHMNIAFNTLNSVLQSKKRGEDKENDDAGLFGLLLAKQLRDFPKEERDELMYEIHGLIINKRRHRSGRVLQPAVSSPIFSRSSSAHGSYYSNDSLPRNISPSSHIIQQPSLYSESDTSSQIIINRPSSSRSSRIRPTTQEISHQTLPVDQQSSQYLINYQQKTTNRPSSSQSLIHQEILHESQYVPSKVHIISQETVQPGSTNILLDAFEKACMERE